SGIVLSGVLLSLGLALSLARNVPRPEGHPPPLATVFRLAFRGQGVDLLDLGLLALIGTPIVRVFVLAVGWGLAGERRFMAVALVVLALLGLSFALGVG